jgi:hypothetical protein
MKQRKQIIVLFVLLAMAGLLWYFEKNDSAVASGASFVAQNYQLLSIENPQIQVDKLDASRKTEYKSSGRNPFSKIAAPPPPAPGQAAQPGKESHHYTPKGPQPLPPPAPPPPLQFPANLKFFGYGTVPSGSARRAFFTDGEEVYIVAEGETLQGRFRIVKVNNTNLEFEELSSGRRSTTPLVEEPVPSGGPT